MRVTVMDMPTGKAMRRWALGAVGLLLVLYLTYVVREIWLPLGLAFLLAVILDPVVDRMETRGWSRPMAAAAIFGSFLVIAGGLVWIAVPHAQKEVTAMTVQLEKQFPATGIDEKSGRSVGIPVPQRYAIPLEKDYKLSPPLADLAARGIVQGQQAVSRSSGSLTKVGLGFAGNLIWVVIIPIVAFYALRDFHLILAKLLLVIPRGRRELAQTYVAEVSAIFARYLRGLAIVSVLNGVATAVVLALCGMNSALLIGVVAGLLYAVPYVGAFLTIGITGALAFIQGGTSLLITVMVASVLLHQIIFDQIISPRILGGTVGLHPILSILALLSGNLLLGIVGMILAVPLAACVQIGVLALVPKLRADVEIAHGGATSEDPDDPARLSQEAKNIQIQREDASDDMHQSVREAVDEIESKIPIAERL